MSRKKKDYIDEIIALGAFVVPPKPKNMPVVTPPVASAELTPEPYELIERKIAAEPMPEAIAAAIATSLISESPSPASVREPLPAETEFLDCVVVSWGGVSGFARPLDGDSKKVRRDGLYFECRDVITEGVDVLRVGTKLRGVVTDNPGYWNSRLTRVEIYKD